ncbi:hypothetical protein H0N99_01300 [Candidatus Micrarchaeota archaeon]|nr:hypothetical protein [Candidatus Micrarchaeota archaeon]
MKKLPIFILLLGCLAGIVYADMMDPFAGVLILGLALIVLLVSWTITLAVELVTSFVYLHLKKLSKWVLLSVILANIISMPLLWGFVIAVTLLSPSMTTYLFALLIGEVGVIVLEAVVIFLVNRKGIKKSDAVAMSVINNMASFLIGVVLVLVARL